MNAKSLALLVSFWPAIVSGQSHIENHNASSPYAGDQSRLIKSLSEQDLVEIARGGGWGLARAPELNGVPGPTHLLELADQIGLTVGQREQIEAIRAQMQADAILAGERFVAAEKVLDRAFHDGVPVAQMLERLVMDAGAAKAALRLIHLNAHLKTLPLLSNWQVSQYSVLRGYSDDPCTNIPDGHDPDMWRSHNDCGPDSLE